MDKARATRMFHELKGTTIAGWLLSDLIDHGKSALVLNASKDGVSAILKLFDPELTERYGEETQRERVTREGCLIGKTHPHLVNIIQAGEDSGYFYVVMEKVQGRPLSRVLAAVPAHQIWTLIGQVASAAEFLEGLGFAHRDIKPDNIMVSDDFKSAILLDLGVLKPFAGKSVTDLEKMPFIGTLQYSSPEFLKRREDPTPEGWRALTFYQLGAVLHDMIMRKRIFLEHEEPFARLVDAVTYVNPEIVSAEAPPQLVSLARTCLSKKPEHRLSYVHWSDFRPQKMILSSLDNLKDQVKKNAEAALGIALDIEDVAQKQYSIRTRTSRLQVQIETIVRDETIGNNLFPPISTHQYPSQNASVAATTFSFAAVAALGLANRLHVMIRTSLIDPGSELVKLEAAAFLTHKGGSHNLPDISEIEGESLFEGSFESSLARERINVMLYKALAQGQAVTNEVKDEILFLKVLGMHE